MRYHLFSNLFEKSIRIKKRKSLLYDQMLATVIHCTFKCDICPSNFTPKSLKMRIELAHERKRFDAIYVH